MKIDNAEEGVSERNPSNPLYSKIAYFDYCD
jgi:hypothetical protein